LIHWLRAKLCDVIWRLERSQLRGTLTSQEDALGAERRDQLAIYQRECEILTSHLRAFPYWTNGHYLLGQRALALRQTRLAYACAQAVLQLENESSDRGKLLLAQAMRHSGDQRSAVLILQELLTRDRNNIIVLEELGVIFSARGELAEALNCLDAIPSHLRSIEVSTALSYLRSKLESSSGKSE